MIVDSKIMNCEICKKKIEVAEGEDWYYYTLLVTNPGQEKIREPDKNPFLNYMKREMEEGHSDIRIASVQHFLHYKDDNNPIQRIYPNPEENLAFQTSMYLCKKCATAVSEDRGIPLPLPEDKLQRLR